MQKRGSSGVKNVTRRLVFLSVTGGGSFIVCGGIARDFKYLMFVMERAHAS